MKAKIIATLFTAIMALSTVSPVLAAYTLGDYPGFLFTDHNLDAYVVAGADAQPADVVGMTDVAVRLAGESYTPTSCGGAGATGVETANVPFYTNVSSGNFLKTTIKYYDIPSVLDHGTVDFTSVDGSDTYDYEEIIYLSNQNDFQIRDSSRSSKDFLTTPALFVPTGGIKYAWKFDETFNASKVSSIYPLTITLLGKEIKITSLSTSSITATAAEEYYIAGGQSITIGTHTVTLENVGTQSAAVSVDGTTKVVNCASDAASVTIGALKVKCTSSLSRESLEQSAAYLTIGEDISKSYNDGTAYVGQDKNNPIWVWDLTCAGGGAVTGCTTGKPEIRVKFDQSYNDPDDPIPQPGKNPIVLPNNYAKLSFDGLTTHTKATYTFEYKTGVDLTKNGDSGDTSAQVFKISSGDSSDPLKVGAIYSDTLYIYTNSTADNAAWVFYRDISDGKVKYGAGPVADTGTLGYITYQDITMGLYWYNTTTPTVVMKESDISGIEGNLAGNYTITLSQSGGKINGLYTPATATDNEIIVYGTSIGNRDEDVLTDIGLVIKAPKSNAGSDKIVMEVPSVQVKGILTFGPYSGVAVTGETVNKVVPITNAVAKLDTEISLPVDKHLVLVGGPAVNRLSAQAMGLTYPTYGASGLLPFGSGEGYIKVFDGTLETGRVAVVVAGWEAGDTRNACSVLQKYTQFATELAGNVAVKVTSVTAAGITPAT